MSVEAQVNERLAALTAAGTSIWLDQISRGLVTSGELERLVRESSLRGVTSNPAIFEKSILGSTDYDDQIRELAGNGDDARRIYEEIGNQSTMHSLRTMMMPVQQPSSYLNNLSPLRSSCRNSFHCAFALSMGTSASSCCAVNGPVV